MKNDGALRTQLFPYLLVAPTVILILSCLVYPSARVFLILILQVIASAVY